MERRNLIIVGVAIVIGLFAVYLVNAWFSGEEARQERIAEQQQLERIAVARVDLNFGDQLTTDNVRLVNWPRQSVPPGAYRDVKKLLADGNVAIRPIASGEPILRQRISERAILSANIPDDMRAVTVPVNAVTGVAGFVLPGDVVDVLLTRQIPGDGAKGDDRMTSVLLENIQVLAIDLRKSERDSQAKVGKTATLLVDQMGAQKLTLANEIGRITLALRNVENQAYGSYRTVTPRDLGGGGVYLAQRREPAAQNAPQRAYAAAPASGVAVAAPPRGPTMTVYRGTAGSTAVVQRHGVY